MCEGVLVFPLELSKRSTFHWMVSKSCPVPTTLRYGTGTLLLVPASPLYEGMRCVCVCVCVCVLN